MNENLNLVEILKDCPKGIKLYSVIYGEVEFEHIQTDYNTDYHYNTDYPIVFKYKDEDDYDCIDSTTIDGKQVCFANGECTLFPSKDQRDWSKFKVESEMVDGEIYYAHTHEKFYIRIGDIPSDEKSKVYRGDAVVGYEDGVSVYDCIEIDGLYRIVMPFPLKEGQGMTYECLIQEITQCRYEIEKPRNVYLVSGMEVGKGHDNEPLIKDVKILKDLTEQFDL